MYAIIGTWKMCAARVNASIRNKAFLYHTVQTRC